MAFMLSYGDPRGEPKLTFDTDEYGKLKWFVSCPFGSHPERQRKAYELARKLNKGRLYRAGGQDE